MEGNERGGGGKAAGVQARRRKWKSGGCTGEAAKVEKQRTGETAEVEERRQRWKSGV